jgi:uroporphyrinogen III methyltransferase/synthase
MAHFPTVHLIGAGPGHPGLITLRAVECLRQADLVLYDKLVPAAMLEHAGPRAELVCVTDLGQFHDLRVVPVHDAMIAAAKAGRRVVRLKGGDPCIFGRGGEEAEVLRDAGVPYELVPGVTAALGAASYAGIPLTHRRHSSAVAFVTGHENPHKPETMLDWDGLARFPGTLVIYMGMSRIDRIAEALIEAGKSPTTPAAVVQQATLGAQRTVVAPLAELADHARLEGLTAPALIIVGDVVKLRAKLAWFERTPLFGKHVLVTRPRHQAGAVVQKLVDLGAVPYVLPTVEIHPIADTGPMDRAIDQLASYDWIVFTSANGVQSFLHRIREQGRDWRALGNVKLAAIGPKTAETLRKHYLEPDLVPTRYQSEDLAAALLERIQPGQRVLLARADRGRELLREQLAPHCHVEQVAVYSQIDALEADEEVLNALRRGEIAYVTLSSSNIARSLMAKLDATCQERIVRGDIRLVSISPVTSEAVRGMGLPVAAEAEHATMDGILEALIELVRREAASAEVAGGVPGEVGDQGAGDRAEDVDHHADPAERDTDCDVQDEQSKQDA